MRIHADGDSYFEKAVLDKAYKQTRDSRVTVVHMSPEEFLAMAKFIKKPSDEKFGRTNKLFKKGVKFNEVPYLRCETMKNGDLQVIAHEGRHRSMNLRDAHVKLLPVVIVSEHGEVRPYRWGLTNSRPTRMHGQTDHIMDMPETETY